MMMGLVGFSGGVHGVTPSAAYTNFASRASAAGFPLTGAQATNYQNLLDGLTTDGFFDGSGGSTILDCVYIFAAENTTLANLNLCTASFTGTASATAPTFTTNTGYTGNGSSAYIDTTYNPSTAGRNYTQNSAAVGTYTLTARTTSASFASLAGQDATRITQIYPNLNSAGAKCYGILNNTSGTGPAATVTSAAGMLIVTRTALNNTTAYLNGSSVNSSAQASAGLPNASLYVLAKNNNGVIADATTDQISAAVISAALNSTQASQLSTRINTYMTAYGINVY